MAVSVKKKPQPSGQAAIELALCLPFLVFLIYYTLKAFLLVHTAQIGQRYAAMSVWQRVNNRAKFVLDDVDNQGGGRLHGRHFMAVRYADDPTGSNGGGFPRRGILGPGGFIINVVGVCLEPDCR